MSSDPTDRPTTYPGSPNPATASSRFRVAWASSAAGTPVPVSFEYDEAPPRLHLSDLFALVAGTVCLATAMAAFWQLLT